MERRRGAIRQRIRDGPETNVKVGRSGKAMGELLGNSSEGLNFYLY